MGSELLISYGLDRLLKLLCGRGVRRDKKGGVKLGLAALEWLARLHQAGIAQTRVCDKNTGFSTHI